MERPNKEEMALLQAKHFINDAKIEHVQDGGGFTIGKDTLTIKVNRLCWGYFEQGVLNALKEKQNLREWSPELFAEDKTCEECKGVGNFPFPDQKAAHDEWNKNISPDDYFYCKPESIIARHCFPCQGTGIVLKKQPHEG